MLSFTQIKEKYFSGEYVMNEIEQIIDEFLTADISLNAIERVKKLSKEELSEALELYYNNLTQKLFNSCLDWKNLEVFLKIENEDLKENVKQWLYSQESFKTIRGRVNPKTLHFQVQEDIARLILFTFDFSIETSELNSLKENLQLLEENQDQYFEANLVFTDKGFILKLGETKQEETPRQSFWKENLVTAVSAGLIVSSIFFSPEIFADDNVDRAIKYATKATMATNPELKEKVKGTIKDVENEVKEFASESGMVVPITVIGYGIKSVVEGKVEVKGKGLKSLGVPMNYNVSIGLDNSYHMGVQGKNPYMKDSEFKIEGSQRHGEQKIEMKLNFDF